MRELYLFRNDLRLADNPGLLHHADGDALLCVYCWPATPAWCNLTGMGEQRERFLRESLRALQEELEAQGQGLLVLHTDPRVSIPQLVEMFEIDRVGVGGAPGYFEDQQLRALRKRLSVPLVVHDNTTLYDVAQLSGGLDKLARQFTPFRRAVEDLPIPTPAESPAKLPPPPQGAQFRAVTASAAKPHPAFPLRGGSPAPTATMDV